ncbi:hypothetical protein QAD02_007683, partial [Eretmocerus hayati]
SHQPHINENIVKRKFGLNQGSSFRTSPYHTCEDESMRTTKSEEIYQESLYVLLDSEEDSRQDNHGSSRKTKSRTPVRRVISDGSYDDGGLHLLVFLFMQHLSRPEN